MVEGSCLSLSTDNAPVTVQGVVKKSPRASSSLLSARALAAVAFLLPATAAFSDTYRFGASVLTFDGHIVTFDNGPTGREHPADFNVDMTEGLTVRVVVVQSLNPAPDTFHVIPPVGYIAIPDTLTVEEGAQGVIQIFTDGLS